MKRLFVIFSLAIASLWADDPEQTLGMKNGRFWNNLSVPPSITTKTGSGEETNKVVFLVGLIEGWKLESLTKDTIPAKEALAWRGGPESTISDLAATVTAVYKDTENQPLPIGWVVMGAFAVQRGDTTRDLVFMALRKHLSKMMDGQPRPAAELDPTDVIIQSHKR